MTNDIRIRTDIGDNKSIKIKLEQDFDLIKILSLNISQEDAYRRFCSDYGVLVGRVTTNNGGIGIPNAKVSIFIPLSNEDENDSVISSLYPYKDVNDTDSNGTRYNLLPKKEVNNDCLTVNGTYPSKEDMLNNPVLLEIHNKYYKYTTTTNESGDYMLFGLPLGIQMVHMDVDLSDIGVFSQYPYDFVRNGTPLELFTSSRKFRKSTDLNTLPQVKTENKTVNIIPFWGDTTECEIGITRLDFNIRYNIEPHSIFLGSVITDDGKNSINRGCKSRRKSGSFCDMNTNNGFIRMVREESDGSLREFNPYGIDLIDDNGVFAYQVPMNLNYVVTDEFGRLVPTSDTRRGIATSSNVRFKFDILQSGNEKRRRFRGSYLVPNHPIKDNSNIDFQFNNTLNKDKSLYTMYWNNIYTVSNFIPKYQRTSSVTRRHTGVKDVDSCSDRTLFPFNKVDGNLNPIYTTLVIFITVFSALVTALNGLIFVLNGIPGVNVSCISLSCSDGTKFAPGCGCKTKGADELRKKEGNITCGDGAGNAYNDCQRTQLADSLDVLEFDFYNDWVNGVLYFPLMRANKDFTKFCNYNADNNNLRLPLYYNETCITDRNNPGVIDDTYYNLVEKRTGFLLKNNDDIIYSPKVGNTIGFATDIINLGSIFEVDILNSNRLGFIGNIPPTTYRIPETGAEETGDGTFILGLNPLLINLDIRTVTVNKTNCDNLKKICQLGVDEEVESNQLKNEIPITNINIDDSDTRKFLMASNLLQNPLLLNDDFNTTSYNQYIGGETTLGNGFPSRNNNSTKLIKYNKLRSYYFYFGLNIGKTAVDVFNKKYFGKCLNEENSNIFINGKITNVSTINESNGSITEITITGVNSNNLTYTWTKDNNIITNSKDLLNQPIGKYTITILDNNTNMQYSRDFFISGLADIDFNLNVSGFNPDTFSINVNNIVGGTANFKFELISNTIVVKSFNSIDRNGVIFNNLDDYIIFSNISYDIKITDSTGYSKLFETKIIFETIPAIVAELVNVIEPTLDVNTNEYNSDGSFRINISGGKSNYTIKVVNSDETYSSILIIEEDDSFYHESEGAPKGNYTYTIEDSIGNKFIGNFSL